MNDDHEPGEEQTRARDEPASPPSESDGSDERLSGALDDLERMLDAGAEGDPDPAAEENVSDDGQYVIPMLNDVVQPGDDPEQTLPGEVDPRALAPLSDVETCRRIVQRLASEVDVIVQTRIDKALKEAARDIRVEVRRHIDIVLPEILDEIAHETGVGPDPAFPADDED